MGNGVKIEAEKGYFETRMSRDPRRSRVWSVITRYLEKVAPIPADGSVLDAGAGYCDFINEVHARERHASDIADSARDSAGPGVIFHQTSCETLHGVPTNHFDIVLASNLLEHLKLDGIRQALSSFKRALKPGGKLIILQPNFRYCYKNFYDDFTHVSPLTHSGLADLLAAEGYRVEKMFPRFMPFSLKSTSLPTPAFLVWLYLRMPWKPFAGQCLIVASSRGA